MSAVKGMNQRYRLAVPEPGTVLHGDGIAFVADTLEEARELGAEYGKGPYFHSLIGRCQLLYKSDIDNGDGHEDAEPGDTTVWYTPDDGRELDRSYECRVWQEGPPPVRWQMTPQPVPEQLPTDVPAGTHAHHRRLGTGYTTGRARHGCNGVWWYIEVEFSGFPRGSRERKVLWCKVDLVSILPSNDWPPKPDYRLTVEDEYVATGSEAAMRALLDARRSRLNAEWEAEQDRLMVSSQKDAGTFS